MSTRLEDDAEIRGAIKVLGHDKWLIFARAVVERHGFPVGLKAAQSDMGTALRLHGRMLMGDTEARRAEREQYLHAAGADGA